MSHPLIAATAALCVCLLLLVGLLMTLLRRSNSRVAEVERRLNDLAADLGGAVEQAEEQGRRTRLLGEISGSIDLDEVLNRSLEALGEVPGVDSRSSAWRRATLSRHAEEHRGERVTKA